MSDILTTGRPDMAPGIDTGLLKEVTEAEGAGLVGDHAAGATVLEVSSGGFRDAGTCRVNDADYAYVRDDDSLSITPALAALAEDGTPVLSLTPTGAVETTLKAQVDLDMDGDPEGDVYPVISGEVAGYYRVGTADAGAIVKVRDTTYGYEIVSRPIDAPGLDGGTVAPGTLPSTAVSDPENLGGGPSSVPASSPALEAYGTAEAIVLVAGDVDQYTTLNYHLSTVPAFVPDASTLLLKTRSTVPTVVTTPDGSVLAPDTDYYFKVVAENKHGQASPSAEVVARLDPAGVSRIITQEVKAGFVLAGKIQVGVITIDPNDGIRIPLATGGVIHFPADGSRASITADLTTTSLTALDNFRMLGVSNELGQGAELYLSNGVVPPTVAPSLSSYFPTQHLEYFEPDATDPAIWRALPSGQTPTGPHMRLFWAEPGFDQVGSTAEHAMVAKMLHYPNYPSSDGYTSELRVVILNGWTPDIETARVLTYATMTDAAVQDIVCTSDGHIWIGYVSYPPGTNANSPNARWKLDKVNSTTGALVQTYDLRATPYAQARFALASEKNSNHHPTTGETLFTIWTDNVTGRVTWQERDAAAPGTVLNTEVTDGPTFDMSVISHAQVNTAWKGAASSSLHVSMPQAKTTGGGTWVQDRALTWDNRTGIRIPAHEFAFGVDDLTGTTDYLVYGQTRDMSTVSPGSGSAGFNVMGYYGPYNFGGTAYSETAVDTFDVTYTWYDANGVTHETTRGPLATTAGPQGASYRITTPAIAGVVHEDSPNSVRVYVKDTPDPEGSAVWTRITSTPGQIIIPWSQEYALPAAGRTVDYGQNLPAANSFASANLTPAELLSAKQDAAGAQIRLSGDGSGRTGPLTWKADGTIDTATSGIGAAKVKLTPTMAGVVSHDIYVRQIVPGVVAMSGYLDVDDAVLTRRDTGMRIPAGMRPPTGELIFAFPQFGGTGAYRYFVSGDDQPTPGMVEFEQSVGNNGPFEGVSAVWFTN